MKGHVREIGSFYSVCPGRCPGSVQSRVTHAVALRIAACFLVGTVHACLGKSVLGGLAPCSVEGKTLAEVWTSDSHVGREGDPLGGREA